MLNGGYNIIIWLSTLIALQTFSVHDEVISWSIIISENFIKIGFWENNETMVHVWFLNFCCL